ncbi:SPFH domain-containing protein [Streptomyces sp. ME02-6991-2A]|uniref:SPFH domain-containing protein n=1 Tax=Streptomyces sp. ME02-6991-2A TaxID=3028677 RepID=UPI0029BE4EAD|nr:SPFH domain-containing protein [Streptomyces sp. ME02-6991-2A]MDX3375146.1 SPFH domain-containing protein [Streptomyces sp. ME02-6991-2A]
MSPDQNPHPLTDHDGRTSGGETPMPLVDDVALHQPALLTPPPLFRPKGEVPTVGEPLVGEDPPAGEASLEVLEDSEVPEAPEAPEAPEVSEVPEVPEVPERSEDLDDPDPAPAAKPLIKPIRLAHPGRSLHLDQFQLDQPHIQPVRRLRTEPSAEWTPLPSYGEESGPGPTPPPDDGPDTQLDLVLDLAPGGRPRATSATVSVSVPAPQPPPHPRRHSVIAGESTASIPVHLLFRDDPEQPEPAALPTTVAHTTTPTTPTDRTPRPRSPRPRVEPPTRPAPLADPRLVERPGPALPGYAALLTGAAGLLGVLALLWWRGALPAAAQSAVGLAPRPYESIGAGVWAGLALLVTVVVLALGGLGRGRVGYAWVLTLFGDYRGSVRRTGLVWVSPLLLRRRVDVRLRHWRSEPLPAVDANGTALRVVVLVVWRIKDTVRAALGIEDHEAYLSAQVESAMARVLSQLPADAFHEDAPTLRNAEAVGDALTWMLKADCEPVGVEVYSAQPTGIEYAPEVAAAMQRRRIAAIDARHRDSVLTSVVDAVDDTVNRLTTRGIVDLDDYERKALVKDLTVAFYTGRTGGGDSA